MSARKGIPLDMMTLWVEYGLWALAGAVLGAGLTAWIGRGGRHLGHSAVTCSEGTDVVVLLERQRLWEASAASAVSLIPVLQRQLEAVTLQTERAAIDLMVHIRALAEAEESGSPGTQAKAEVSKVVMAMQFQDITRQKLGHVSDALDQFKQQVQALQNGLHAGGDLPEMTALQSLQASYTMEEERRLHAEALSPDYQTPGPVELGKAEKDSVTLF